jgi:hypothetical protein
MDPTVEKLRSLFLNHPAWLKAAEPIKDGASSRVLFAHLPSEYQLLRQDGQSLLLEGPAVEPDFAFYFPKKAIDRLCAVQGTEQADFAIALFDCVVSEDPDEQVGLRILAGLGQIFWKGYLTMLLRGGPRVLAYGARRGLHSVADLRKFLKHTRASHPRWENL